MAKRESQIFLMRMWLKRWRVQRKRRRMGRSIRRLRFFWSPKKAKLDDESRKKANSIYWEEGDDGFFGLWSEKFALPFCHSPKLTVEKLTAYGYFSTVNFGKWQNGKRKFFGFVCSWNDGECREKGGKWDDLLIPLTVGILTKIIIFQGDFSLIPLTVGILNKIIIF